MKRVSFKRLLLFYFLFMVEANFVHPIEPALFLDRGFPSWMFGAAFATMCLSTALFSPFWGQLGDRIGHEKVFFINCLLYAVGQYLYYRSGSVPLTLAVRFLSGITCGGNIVACQSYASLSSAPEDRAKNLAFLAAAECVGTAAGFLIGGLMGDVSLGLPFFVQIPATVILGTAGLFFLGSVTLEEARGTAIDFRELNPVSSFVSIRHMLDKPLIVYFVFIAVFFGGYYCMDQTFNYYLRDVFGFPTSYNGAIKAAIGIIGFAANMTVNQWINRHADHRTAVPVFCCLFACLALLAPLSGSVKLFIVLIGFSYLCHATLLPLLQTLVVKNAGGSGSAFGAYNATRHLGTVAGALYAGFIYGVSPKLPFFSAAALVFITALLALWDRKLYRNKEKAV